MPKNYLYSMINKDFIAESIGKLPLNISVKKILNAQNKSYFMFELPKTGKEVLGDYILLDHHVSVYENSLTKLDEKSPYHYTAHFCNAKKERFRLHIYYNNKNQCINRPVLEKVLKQNEFLLEDKEEYDNVFYTFSQLHINKLVSFLKQKHEVLIAELEAECNLLDKSSIALSAALPAKKEAYVAALRKQIVKLKELLTYSLADKHARINGIMVMLEGFIRSVETYQNEKEEKAAKRAVLVDITNVGNASVKTTTAIDKVVSNTLLIDGRTVKKKTDLRFQLAKLKEQIAALKAKKERAKNEISDLLIDLIGIESEIDKGLYSSDLSDRYELKALREDLEHFILNSLEQLLIAEKFEQANELGPSYSLLPEKILYDALAQNKLKLIDHLLKNKYFRFNAAHFIYQGQHYSSLIDYYFKNVHVLVSKGEMTAKLSQVMAMSLGILVKNKQSLMEIDSHTGIPFAAVLLIKEPKHPLSFALDLNKATTIGNALFCKQLKQVLYFVVAQANCSEANKNLIPQLIKQLDNIIASLPSASSQLRLNGIKAPVTKIRETASGIALYEEIYSDPVVTWMTNKADNHIASFQWNKPVTQQAELFNDTAFIIRTLDLDNDFELGAAALMEIRTAIVNRKKAIIDFITLGENLFAIQSFKAAANKSDTKLKQKEELLAKRFVELETAVADSNAHLYMVIKNELQLRNSIQSVNPAPNAMCREPKQQKMPDSVTNGANVKHLAEDLISFVVQAASADSKNKSKGMDLGERKALLMESFMRKMRDHGLVGDLKKDPLIEPKDHKTKELSPPLTSRRF